MPRFRSSGALSMAPYSRKLARPLLDCRLVIAAVSVVCHHWSMFRMRRKRPRTFPWSTWPIVPGEVSKAPFLRAAGQGEHPTNVHVWLVSLECCGVASHRGDAAAGLKPQGLLNGIDRRAGAKSSATGPPGCARECRHGEASPGEQRKRKKCRERRKKGWRGANSGAVAR